MTDAPTTSRGAGHEDAAGIESPSSTQAVVSVRPLGTPMPLGLFGLAAASLVVSGLELGWISTSQRIFVGVVIVAFPVSLQLVASVLSFLSRDAATASGLGVLATTWLATGRCSSSRRPARRAERWVCCCSSPPSP
jgi:succinate-acetate transporter protein